MTSTHSIVEMTGGPYDGQKYMASLSEEFVDEKIVIRSNVYDLRISFDETGLPFWVAIYNGMGSKSP